MTTIETVSPYPSATSRDLDGWLSEDLAALHPAEAPTRLRALADTQAARIGAWAAGVSVGLSTGVVGLALLLVTGRISSVPLIGGGFLFAGLCMIFLLRVGHRLPDTGRLRSVRGPARLRDGVIAALVIYLPVTALMVVATFRTGGVFGLIIVNVAYLLLLVSAFVVPSAVLGRGREAFRRRARTDVLLRARLEEDRLSWKPERGTPMYGPL
ncbi:hypothetical protein [Microbacterium aurantiacum]|uniref:hypothetical protein n=1 Tax=Microbacterium aurantiacum TaxID=162393 RepID=UPI000C7FEE56|nr:hypothetical protein [Microbacterium aurantiacum]